MNGRASRTIAFAFQHHDISRARLQDRVWVENNRSIGARGVVASGEQSAAVERKLRDELRTGPDVRNEEPQPVVIHVKLPAVVRSCHGELNMSPASLNVPENRVNPLDVRGQAFRYLSVECLPEKTPNRKVVSKRHHPAEPWIRQHRRDVSETGGRRAAYQHGIHAGFGDPTELAKIVGR